MLIEFGCGTELEWEDIPNYVFEYTANGWLDSGIGNIGDQYWNVNLSRSEEHNYLSFIETDGDSRHLRRNREVNIGFEGLAVVGPLEQTSHAPMTLEDQKTLARTVLAQVRVASPKAVVAGGAARCFFQGERANDIDIFLDVPSYLSNKEVRGMLKKLLPDYSVRPLRGGSAASPSQSTGLQHAFYIRKDGQEVQLLVVSGRPDVQMELFPFSHTQVSWDGNDFTTAGSFDLFVDFKVVVRNYTDMQEAYKTKVENLIAEKGWRLAESQDEALTMAMDSVTKGV